ncbi:MAG: gliding motility protein GldM, partial [Muribaculaceae bacterium]|nr:gliding motility protein GldM [Muribaculaceae bacterium]
MAENLNRLSARQKMINLMYIVLTAMLALNVSSDVLDGFTQVDEGLNRSNANVDERNKSILQQLEAFAAQNPEKGQVWYEQALEVREVTDRLYNQIDSIKLLIVQQADGPEGNVAEIINRDNLEAASVVMLAPGNENGAKLRLSIDQYRDYIISKLPENKRVNVEAALSTDPVQRKGVIGATSWEESKFDNQPVVAAITLLTKLQNDVRFAEGEALNTLLSNVDAGDVRVNELNAFVIPQSRLVMRGGKYSADIVLAAVDTTARPIVYINGKALDNNRGHYELFTGSTGTFTYKGYLEVPHGDGTTTRHEFASDYTVIEPSATISPTMMNVLYAGIENPISISVPGVPMSAVSATMTNGTLTRKGDAWVAHPGKVGSDAEVSVTATIDGRSQSVGSMKFRVRKLPDPSPYIAYRNAQGQEEAYRGGKPIAKKLLLESQGLDAAIDDGILNIKFKVVS